MLHGHCHPDWGTGRIRSEEVSLLFDKVTLEDLGGARSGEPSVVVANAIIPQLVSFLLRKQPIQRTCIKVSKAWQCVN